ncbi:MAG: cytochrome d ubiquinol oxidase subunit II [Gammaproteobacteria bacterium]|nr:cytochrome d ubiquinol oxidase subunit II [Gammaproteobacteria bacterium]
MDLFGDLQVTWWLLLGVLLVGLGVMVGMDMGVGTLLRYVGRSDVERRVALNVIGPHWEGNQVWFILGGGAIFAAFPLIYATAFSGFYVVMMLLLWTMIVRPLGFEYRSKIADVKWRNVWDWSLFVSGAVPMIIFGAAVGNLFCGVPYTFAWDMASVYTGSFLGLLNPFAISTGLLSLALSVMMGGLMLMHRTEGALRERARRAAAGGSLAAIILFAGDGIWVRALDGYRLVRSPQPGTLETPLEQIVTRAAGAWRGNFSLHPVLWVVPIVAFLALFGAYLAARTRRGQLGWWCGALAWAGVIGTAGAGLFPFLLPSSQDPSVSLTVWNASSSRLTLEWMLGFAVVFVPIILWYTSWAFWVMRGQVKPEHVAHDEHVY